MASDSPGDHQNYLGPDNGEMNAPGAPAGNLFITRYLKFLAVLIKQRDVRKVLSGSVRIDPEFVLR